MTDELRPAAVPGLHLASLVPGASGVLTGVTLDSRRVRPGDLYVGLPGAVTHGARFAAAAAASGALAVLTDAVGADLVGVSVGGATIRTSLPSKVSARMFERAKSMPRRALTRSAK